MNNRVMFYVINEEGIREDARMLAKYKLSNGNNYITPLKNQGSEGLCFKRTAPLYKRGTWR